MCMQEMKCDCDSCDCGGTYKPPISIYNFKNRYEFFLEMPKKDVLDLSVTLQYGVLRVSGIRQIEAPEIDQNGTETVQGKTGEERPDLLSPEERAKDWYEISPGEWARKVPVVGEEDDTVQETVEKIEDALLETEDEDGELIYNDRPDGRFERLFPLDEDVDQDSIKAFWKDGLLKVSIQKTAQAIKEETLVEIKVSTK